MNAIFSELLAAGIYKRSQGKIARQLTFAALAATVMLGCWRLSETWADADTWLRYGIPGAIMLGGLWISFRVVNVPRFADFLIAVEAEMNKVTWPSRRELFRASIVVLLVIFLLATVLFLYDLVWHWALYDVLNISGNTPPSPK